VPLYARHQEHAIGFVRVPVHEGFDTLGRLPEWHYVKGTDDWRTHGCFVNSVVREHVRLSFSRRGAMTTHGRKNEGPSSVLFPELDNRFDNTSDIGDAPATYSDGDTAALRDTGCKLSLRQLVSNVLRNVRNRAVREKLFNGNESREIHFSSIALPPWARRKALFCSVLLLH